MVALLIDYSYGVQVTYYVVSMRDDKLLPGHFKAINLAAYPAHNCSQWHALEKSYSPSFVVFEDFDSLWGTL